MSHWKNINKLTYLAIRIIGFCLTIIIWWLLKSFIGITDRILPAIADVIGAIDDFEPSLWIHIISTLGRLVVGFMIGIIVGILLGLILFRYAFLEKLLLPTVQALRSVPPIATVPFFILWFGFSELGKYTMVIVGIAFNITVASFQILSFIPEKYQVMFRSFGRQPQKLVFNYMLPKIIEELLPTIRFSLSTALGLVIVSELLGAQVGLGYLIQTSRSTYSMHVIFLVMIILGLISSLFDKLIVILWQKLTFWKK